MTIACNSAYVQTDFKLHLRPASRYCVFCCRPPNFNVLASYFCQLCQSIHQ